MASLDIYNFLIIRNVDNDIYCRLPFFEKDFGASHGKASKISPFQKNEVDGRWIAGNLLTFEI